MADDTSWDADSNGIPDSIQRDPVVVPEDPGPEGLPGITAPIEASGADDPRTDLEMDLDVILNKSRVANKAADELDDYIRN
jgi:hypothetical protein